MSAGIRAHALISGRVQGVYYRASAAEQASALGLAGWVRNLRDGRVELVAEGPPAAVEALLVWCAQGPAHARVVGVEVERDLPAGLSGPFVVRPSA